MYEQEPKNVEPSPVQVCGAAQPQTIHIGRSAYHFEKQATKVNSTDRQYTGPRKTRPASSTNSLTRTCAREHAAARLYVILIGRYDRARALTGMAVAGVGGPRTSRILCSSTQFMSVMRT